MNTSFQAFLDHPEVAVHLRHFDFESSETRPRYYLLLDRAECRLYALPVRLAQQFLQLQWREQGRPSDNQAGTGTCTGYLDHPFKNKHVQTEKDRHSLLANAGGSV